MRSAPTTLLWQVRALLSIGYVQVFCGQIDTIQPACDNQAVNEHDKTTVRDLAKRVAEIAALPEMTELRDIWKRHHGLERVRPMILVFPENSWGELLPADTLECEDPSARGYEADLRRRLYYFDHIHDDTVIENTYVVNKAITNTGWGLQPQWVWSSQSTGAGTYKPVIVSP